MFIKIFGMCLISVLASACSPLKNVGQSNADNLELHGKRTMFIGFRNIQWVKLDEKNL